MDLYLAGIADKRYGYFMNDITDLKNFGQRNGENRMNVLAGTMYGNQGKMLETNKELIPSYTANKIDIAILESFYYADEWTEKAIPLLDKFLLDSGAFTFMSNVKDSKKVDFDAYLTRYINFINKNDVKLFFELDVDSVVGYEKVKQMRKRLESETQKKCIPVWHKSRGLEEWYKLTSEYDYVAIGGIVSKEITRQEYKYFPKLLEIARENGCKVHGLGFTNLEGLKKYKFYSVDSTAWTTGNRFGSVYKFNGHTMVKYSKKDGQKLADSRAVAVNNFNEWVKFQKYADTHL